MGIRKGIADRALGRKLHAKEAGWFPWPRIERYAAARSLPWRTTDPFGGTPGKQAEVPIELTAYQPLLADGDLEKLPNGREYFHSYFEKLRQRAEGDVSGKSFKRLHRYRYSPTLWYESRKFIGSLLSGSGHEIRVLSRPNWLGRWGAAAKYHKCAKPGHPSRRISLSVQDVKACLFQILERRIVKPRITCRICRIAMWNDDHHSLAGAR